MSDDLGLGQPIEIDWRQLVAIFPNWLDKPNAEAVALAANINKGLAEIGAVTHQVAAFFIAQVGHETGNFQFLEEVASGAAYEGRKDLGNVKKGDGRRYKGRGAIQVTGRTNYRDAGKALGLPLEDQPELAASHDVGMRVAAWYWNSRKLTEHATRGNFALVTRRINGGYNGWRDRVTIYRRACAALGIKPIVISDDPPRTAPRPPA
jgi:putative chitinase